MNLEHELTLKELRKFKRLYSIWSGIKQRCNNPNCNRYQYYGARGIKVCKEWEADYRSFAIWSLDNGYNDNLSADRAYNLSIDRLDTSKDYCPENCRWIPAGLNSSLAMSKKYGRSEAWSFENWDKHHKK